MSEVDQLRRKLAEAAPDFAPVHPGAIRARVDRRRRLAVAGAAGGTAVLVAAVVLVPRPGTDPAPIPVAGSSAASSTGPATAPRACPRPSPDGIVDYVPFVTFGGVSYVQSSGRNGGARPAVGTRFGVVRCTLEEIQPGGDYRAVDGDSAFLPVGTVLYATPGVPASFRLTTADGRVFEAGWGDQVRTGADLLPLRGLVTAIDVRGPADELPPGAVAPLRHRITDPAQVRAVLAGIAAAPVVDRSVPVSTGQVLFRLTDGTVVGRNWSRPDRLLEGHIELSPAVLALLRD